MGEGGAQYLASWSHCSNRMVVVGGPLRATNAVKTNLLCHEVGAVKIVYICLALNL